MKSSQFHHQNSFKPKNIYTNKHNAHTKRNYLRIFVFATSQLLLEIIAGFCDFGH